MLSFINCVDGRSSPIRRLLCLMQRFGCGALESCQNFSGDTCDFSGAT
jgi:hypothetical protein